MVTGKLLTGIIRGTLTLVIFGGSVASIGWAAELVDTSAHHQARVDTRREQADDLDEDRSTASQGSHPPRSVQTWIWLNPTRHGFALDVEHVIHLRPDDPMVEQVRASKGLDRDWHDEVVGALWLGSVPPDEDFADETRTDFQRPILRVDRPGSPATVWLRERATQDFASRSLADDAVLEIRMMPATDESSARTVKIAANGWSPVGITGQTPEKQDERSITYSTTPLLRTVIAWTANGGSPYASDIPTALKADEDDEDSGDSTSSFLDPSWSQWLFVFGSAWLVLFIHARRSTTNVGAASAARLRRPLRSVALEGLIIAPFLASVLAETHGSEIAGYLLLFLLPATSYVLSRWAAMRPIVKGRDLFVGAAVVFVALPAGLLWLTVDWSRPPDTIGIMGLLTVGSLGMGIACVAMNRRRLLARAAAVSMIVGGLAAMMAAFVNDASVATTTPLLSGTGVVWALALGLLIRPLSVTSPRKRRLATVIIGALALLPGTALSGLSSPSVFLYTGAAFATNDSITMGPGTYALLTLTLIGALVLTMRRLGCDGESIGAPLTRGVALALLMIEVTTATPVIDINWWDVWRVLATLAAFSLLLPNASAKRAAQLALMPRSTHQRLIRLDLRHRLLKASVDDLRRSARAQLAAGEMSIATFDERQRALETEDLDGQRRPDWNGIREEAFGSSFGYTPWQNAAFAAKIGLILALPYIIYEEMSLFNLDSDILYDRSTTIATTIGVAAYLARWAVYASIFGYFYPLVQGRSPMGKSLALWAALLSIEIIPLFDGTWDLNNLAIAIVIRAGQLLAFAMGLGIAWEVRAMRAAEFAWSRLRNIRNLRSLGPPAAAVVIAAATAAATVLASSTVSAILNPPATVEKSETPHPSQNTP
jgi:hypothetical protein